LIEVCFFPERETRKKLTVYTNLVLSISGVMYSWETLTKTSAAKTSENGKNIKRR
jgi:hypothetical protein